MRPKSLFATLREVRCSTFFFLGLVISACAEGRPSLLGDAEIVDAPTPDSRIVALVDAGNPDSQVVNPPADAALADAGEEPLPDAAMTPDACVPKTANLLGNPKFDVTPVVWGEESSGGFAVIGPDAEADTAPNSAWLGGFDPVEDAFFQTVTFPADTSSVVLKGKRWIASAETSTSVAFDTVRVELRTPGGLLIEQLKQFSNLDESGAWINFSLSPTVSLAGQTVQVRFAGSNDQSNITNFFFDTLALTVTSGCQ